MLHSVVNFFLWPGVYVTSATSGASLKRSLDEKEFHQIYKPDLNFHSTFVLIFTIHCWLTQINESDKISMSDTLILPPTWKRTIWHYYCIRAFFFDNTAKNLSCAVFLWLWHRKLNPTFCLYWEKPGQDPWLSSLSCTQPKGNLQLAAIECVHMVWYSAKCCW